MKQNTIQKSHANQNATQLSLLLIIHRSNVNQKNLTKYSNISFGFIYYVHRKDTCLPETRVHVYVQLARCRLK